MSYITDIDNIRSIVAAKIAKKNLKLDDSINIVFGMNPTLISLLFIYSKLKKINDIYKDNDYLKTIYAELTGSNIKMIKELNLKQINNINILIYRYVNTMWGT